MATETKAPCVKVKFTFDGVLPVEHYDKSGMNLNLLVLDAIKEKCDDCFAKINNIPGALWTSSEFSSEYAEHPFKTRLNHRPIEKKEAEMEVLDHVHRKNTVYVTMEGTVPMIGEKQGKEGREEEVV